MTEQIREREYKKEMSQSYIDYAMTTITDRALPDVRDGLKPVHRRLLFGMRMLGITPDKPHKKSARIVGDVMGKYHPHGDSSLYDAMVRMAQDHSLYVPLVDGHGNFGSIDGDSAAAMRYTEARLSKAGDMMLNDLEKDVVEFRPNYDDTEREPAVLPARFPNLLINGVEGIATGMSTNIPTHNPTEVAEALLYVLKTKNPTIDGVMKHLSAPDFPYGGLIINEEEVKEFYRTGYGRVVMRAKHHTEPASYGKTKIVITEIPKKSMGSKTRLLNTIIELVNDRTLDEVVDVVDESNREGIRMVIEVRKGTDIDDFLNKLWLKTKLQDSERMQFLVLVDGQPKTISVLEYFQHYIAFQEELTYKRYTYLLNRTNARLEVVQGLITAHGMIDAVIDAIRGSKTTQDAENCLVHGNVTNISFSMVKNRKLAENFSFTQSQTEAILNMRLQRLIGLEMEKLDKEQKLLLKQQKEAHEILTKPARLMKELVKDAEEIKKLYPWERRSAVTTASTRKILQKKVVRNVTVVVDRFGYIKLTEDKVDEKDQVTFKKEATSNDKVVVFTNKGNIYQLKVKDIPSGKKKDRGTPLQVLAEMDDDEVMLHVTVDTAFEEAKFLFLTKMGNSKVVNGTEFKTIRKKLQGTRLQDEDVLVAVLPVTEKQEVVVLTHRGRGVRTKVNGIVQAKRNTIGNKIARLPKEDWFVSALIPDTESINVNGKDINVNDIPIGKANTTVKPL